MVAYLLISSAVKCCFSLLHLAHRWNLLALMYNENTEYAQFAMQRHEVLE